MARTNLTKTAAPGPYSHAGVVITMAAADVANMNQFTASGNDIVIARNSGASTRTVTVTSAPDERGRTKDIAAENILAGEIKLYDLRSLPGWVQTDGKVYLQANNAEVLLGVVAL